MTAENKAKQKLSAESAQEELKRFYDYYEIDKEDMNEDQLKAVESLEGVFTKGIQKGLIEFKDGDDGFSIVQTLKSKETIVYRELDGQAKITMDKKEDGVGKCYTLLGCLCGEGSAVIQKLKGPDLKRAEHIGGMLLFC